MSKDHKDNQNPLMGRCPVCSGPEASTGQSDAYVSVTLDNSDKDVELVWSEYYQLYVCRLCKIRGIDLTVDAVRDKDDRDKKTERQQMGFVKSYTTNSIN